MNIQQAHINEDPFRVYSVPNIRTLINIFRSNIISSCVNILSWKLQFPKGSLEILSSSSNDIVICRCHFVKPKLTQIYGKQFQQTLSTYLQCISGEFMKIFQRRYLVCEPEFSRTFPEFVGDLALFDYHLLETTPPNFNMEKTIQLV